jgi:hypothetical protein
MWQSLIGGYKLSLGVLALELLLFFGLVPDSLGIFMFLAMPVVAISWLPAALFIVRDVLAGDAVPFTGYPIAAICALTGALALYLLLKWTVLGLAVR